MRPSTSGTAQERLLQAPSEDEVRLDRGEGPEGQAQLLRDQDHQTVQANLRGRRIHRPIALPQGHVPERDSRLPRQDDRPVDVPRDHRQNRQEDTFHRARIQKAQASQMRGHLHGRHLRSA